MFYGSREFLRLRLTVSPSTAADTVDLDGVLVDLRVGEDPVWRRAEVLSAVVERGIGTVRVRLLIGEGTPTDPDIGEHRVLARVTTRVEAVVVEARPWLSVGRP